MVSSQFRYHTVAAPWRAVPVGPPGLASPCPFDALLSDLRGREVVLTFGPREARGKLVLINPVTLVGPGGEVIVVKSGMVTSVQF